jgi:hypothetical protein
MSKRKADGMDKEASKLLSTEAKLHDLQSFAYDMIVTTRAGKEGATKSTRAFADPLLNLEIKLLREREATLIARVTELEMNKSATILTTSNNNIDANVNANENLYLRRENEELKQQLGEIGQQMHTIRNEIQDSRILELNKYINECNSTINILRNEKEIQSNEIFNLKARIKDILSGNVNGNGNGNAGNSGSDSDSDEDFSSLFAAAKNKKDANND